jgi:hypothetical protein
MKPLATISILNPIAGTTPVHVSSDKTTKFTRDNLTPMITEFDADHQAGCTFDFISDFMVFAGLPPILIR